jgi:hypothetical protein
MVPQLSTIWSQLRTGAALWIIAPPHDRLCNWALCRCPSTKIRAGTDMDERRPLRAIGRLGSPHWASMNIVAMHFFSRLTS